MKAGVRGFGPTCRFDPHAGWGPEDSLILAIRDSHASSDDTGGPLCGSEGDAPPHVADRRLVKVLAWYDNGWGDANRRVELAALVANAYRAAHA